MTVTAPPEKLVALIKVWLPLKCTTFLLLKPPPPDCSNRAAAGEMASGIRHHSNVGKMQRRGTQSRLASSWAFAAR